MAGTYCGTGSSPPSNGASKSNGADVEGEARREFIRQAELDFQDFAMLGAAEAELDDGVLTLRIDLRPSSDS